MFASIDRSICANLARVQRAFRRQRIGPHHFQGSTGYGHGDMGREALDNVSSRVKGCMPVCVCGRGSRAQHEPPPLPALAEREAVYEQHAQQMPSSNALSWMYKYNCTSFGVRTAAPANYR